MFPGFTGLGGGKSTATCLLPVSGYGAEGCVRLTDSHTVPFSPTHPYDHRTTEATQRASRQRSKLAEASQEGEKGRGK
jgi:hypothetical protein